MNNWISIKERLPKSEDDVLIFADDGVETTIMVAYWREDAKWWDGTYIGWIPGWMNVTHWMPLPEPPREEKE